MTGPVALLGSGEFLPVMEQLDRRLLHGRPSRVVHLPTAAGQESGRRLRYWRDLARSHFQDRLGVEVETIGVLDTRTANDPSQVARLEGAGLIYMSGGNPGYLAAALRNSAVLRRIHQLMDEGVAVAGCSAGASALTAVAPDVRSGNDTTGLALIPGLAVIPHYDAARRRWKSMVEMFTRSVPEGVTVIGVDENTAIVSDDRSTFEVYGVGTAVRLGDGSVYGPGDSFVL